MNLSKEEIQKVLQENAQLYETYTTLDVSGWNKQKIDSNNEVIDALNERFNLSIYDRIRDRLKVIPKIDYPSQALSEEQQEKIYRYKAAYKVYTDIDISTLWDKDIERMNEEIERYNACIETEEQEVREHIQLIPKLVRPEGMQEDPVKLEFYTDTRPLSWTREENEILRGLNNFTVDRGSAKGQKVGEAIVGKAKTLHLYRQMMNREVSEYRELIDYCGAISIIEAINNVAESLIYSDNYYTSEEHYITIYKDNARDTAHRIYELCETAKMMIRLNDLAEDINKHTREIGYLYDGYRMRDRHPKPEEIQSE